MKILAAIALASVLMCPSCVPPKPSGEIIKYEGPHASVHQDAVSGEAVVRAEAATPTVCEGDSVTLRVRIEVVGVPKAVNLGGKMALLIEEAHIDGQAEYALFQKMDDGRLLLRAGAHNPALPCDVKTLQVEYILEATE